jgi:hypothetical protein
MLEVIAIVAGALLVPLVAWRIVGARRHRDPLLLPALILALGFTLGGVGEQLAVGGPLDWKLIFGVAGFVVFAMRWRALASPRRPAA